MRRVVLLLSLLAPVWAASMRAQIFQPVTCKNAFTREQEIAEGQKVVDAVYKQMPVLPDSDPATQYVRQIGARLVAAAPLTPGMQQQWPFRFHVVADKEINAFALPGGTMFINLGAIRAAETEAQLAGVMGHEMSHVILRHSTCNITRQQKKSIFYGLGAIGSAILLGNSAAGALAQQGIGFGANLDFLHMSRGDEQQADLLGAQIVYNAGYDPRGLPQFFEIIEAKYGAGGAQILSDHPNPGNRREYIDAEIAQLPPLAHPIVNTDGFRAMKARAMTLPVYDAKQMQAGAWRKTGLYASAPEAGASVIAASAPTAGSSATAGAPTSAAPMIAPLSASQLGLNDALQRYQAPRWSLPAPQSWRATAADGGDVTIAPEGAAGSFGLAYGVVAGVAQQTGNGVTDAPSLQQATLAYEERLAQASNLAVAAQPVSMRVDGQLALATMLQGSSPVGSNGIAQRESDWLITIARPDGDLSYFLFVAPQADFTTLKPLFDRMLAGARVQ